MASMGVGESDEPIVAMMDETTQLVLAKGLRCMTRFRRRSERDCLWL